MNTLLEVYRFSIIKKRVNGKFYDTAKTIERKVGYLLAL